MAEKQEKIIIAGFDLTDYVAQKNATSMRLFGEPSEDVTPSDLLDHCLYLAKTIEQRKAILNEYKAHPEKYPDMVIIHSGSDDPKKRRISLQCLRSWLQKTQCH